jgi:MoaA/NifB/PqqE/SkfB family radical SAM enzyme
MIDRDYKFVSKLSYTDPSEYGHGFFPIVLTEVTDKCNIDCPHCYHIPDNTVPDVSMDQIMCRIKDWHNQSPNLAVCLAGAEPTLYKKIVDLIGRISTEINPSNLLILTNGIKFADKSLLEDCKSAGLKCINVGLNHPSYINNTTIRKKQLEAIENGIETGMLKEGYVGYTMSSISELEDILEETTTHDWNPAQFRIRYGSDIGRYPDQERMYVSDIVKATRQWCKRNKKSFEILNDWDNNIYHVMVKIEGKMYRLIQWCDETDIDMEELRSGPFCDFVSDGITNFLHQVIRRDVLKNQKIILPDAPPIRYQAIGMNDKSPLDFSKLY